MLMIILIKIYAFLLQKVNLEVSCLSFLYNDQYNSVNDFNRTQKQMLMFFIIKIGCSLVFIHA
jgi:hypothetical protein